MKAFHTIAGLPRAGTTAVGDLLAQNPDIEVLQSSPLPGLLDFYEQGVCQIPEIKGMHHHNQADTDARTIQAARNMIRGFSGARGKVVIDKSRLWNTHLDALEMMFPEAKLIACVRDLRAVYGSMEKRWGRNPFMRALQGRTRRQRMNGWFDIREGTIGMALAGIEELVFADSPKVMWLQYESFVESPRLAMQRIYQHLGMPDFEHDFDNVVSTAVDLDALWLGGYPHKHEGAVKIEQREDWQEHVPSQLAQEINANFSSFQQRFGYV